MNKLKAFAEIYNEHRDILEAGLSKKYKRSNETIEFTMMGSPFFVLIASCGILLPLVPILSAVELFFKNDTTVSGKLEKKAKEVLALSVVTALANDCTVFIKQCEHKKASIDEMLKEKKQILYRFNEDGIKITDKRNKVSRALGMGANA